MEFIILFLQYTYYSLTYVHHFLEEKTPPHNAKTNLCKHGSAPCSHVPGTSLRSESVAIVSA